MTLDMDDQAFEHLTNIVTWAALWDVYRNSNKNRAVYDVVLPYFGFGPETTASDADPLAQ